MKTKDSIIKQGSSNSYINPYTPKETLKKYEEAIRANERIRIGKKLLDYSLGERIDKKDELAIKEITNKIKLCKRNKVWLVR